MAETKSIPNGGITDEAMRDVAENIAFRLRNVPWQYRTDLLADIREISGFCWNCGIDDPNHNCQCENDE